MADSVQKTLIDTTYTEIDGLSLTYGAAQSPSLKKFRTPNELPRNSSSFPLIAIASLGSEKINSDPREETNKSDTIDYPVYVAILTAGNADQSFDADELPYTWRESIVDHFLHNRFSGLPTGCSHLNTLVEPGPTIDPSAWKDNIILSSLTLRYRVRKQRRIS